MISFLLAICALALATRWVAHAAATAGIPPVVTAAITSVI
jgi:hypothetical protein